MTDSLQISTGVKHIAITRDSENVGELVFNPSDAIFAEKFYKIVSEFETKFAEYESRSQELDKLQGAEAITLLVETCAYMRERIDYLFGSGTSQLVFGDAMVIEAFTQFFDGIAPFFQTARAKKIAKYTNGNGHKKPRKKK